MRKLRALVGPIAAMMLGTSVFAERCFAVPDFDVHYLIHDNPTNPQSAVVFTVSLYLTPGAQSGSSVGWRIQTATFKQYNNGQVVGQWSLNNATFSTADGRWWITHRNPDAPALSEFCKPPLFVGTAASTTLGASALIFSFEGDPYTPPPTGPPYPHTGAFTYAFTIVGGGEPVEEGEEEPQEVDDDPDAEG